MCDYNLGIKSYIFMLITNVDRQFIIVETPLAIACIILILACPLLVLNIYLCLKVGKVDMTFIDVLAGNGYFLNIV